MIYINMIEAENLALKAHNDNLENMVAGHYDMLKIKVDEIESYTSVESIAREKLSDYSSNLVDVTEKYINNSLATLAVNRSTANSSASFIADITELRSLLKYLEKTNEQEDALILELNDTKEKIQNFLDKFPTLWPANGNVSSPFGMRMHPIYNKKMLHTGVDITGRTGDPIYAAASGTVIFSGVNGGYGNCIIIDHGDHLTTYYAHCSKLLVKKGDKVDKGDLVGKVGSTGTSTAPHLHFEIRVDNTPIDPLKYLNRATSEK